MAQGTVLLGPKKDNATSGGGGQKSRRGGSKGGDGGTSKRKPVGLETKNRKVLTRSTRKMRKDKKHS
jgi:hypothetical protein